MLPDEKEKLIAFLADQRQWCRDAEARDAGGQPVHYNDPSATAWDITGAMCLLFGWPRALELFPQVDRHVRRSKAGRCSMTDPGIASMASLQDANDDTATSFETVRKWLVSMPVWNGPRPSEAARPFAPERAGKGHSES